MELTEEKRKMEEERRRMEEVIKEEMEQARPLSY